MNCASMTLRTSMLHAAALVRSVRAGPALSYGSVSLLWHLMLPTARPERADAPSLTCWLDMRGIVCFEVSPGESGMLLQSREGKEYRFAALDDESYLAWKEAISNATGIAPNISSQELLGVKEDFRTKLSLSPRGRRQRASLGEAAEQGWVYVTGGKTGVRRQYAMLLENSLQLFAGPEKTGEPLQVIGASRYHTTHRPSRRISMVERGCRYS